MSESTMLATLRLAALEAGKRVRALQAEADRTRQDKGNLGDLVTSADLESQQIITRHLQDTKLPLIGEEQSNPETLPPEYVNFDPVDGTGIFAAGCAEYGIALAHVKDGQPQCGVLHQPDREVLIVSEDGKGCFRLTSPEREPVRLVHALPLRKTIVGVDLGPERHRDKVEHLLVHLADHVQYVRILGTAVGSTIALLEGKIGAYVCPDAKAWDLCAGALAVQEAGGVALDPDGLPLRWDRLRMHGLFAANQALADELLPLTRPWMEFVSRASPP